mmetsp:Transcript_25987/g.72783  ORF Transcript_25987/g.72783 Transcript_25987/m.72783 type:complete len:345 (+) Transcript_25987:407-1441(+)
MQVVLRLCRKIVIDHQGHLLHVDATRQQVGGDEHAGGARAELAHDDVAGVLVHVAVGGGDGVVALAHLLSEPVHLAAGVRKDNRLGDSQSLIQITQGVQLPLLTLNINVELLDTLKGQLVTLHQNTDRLGHELPGDLQGFGGQGGGENTDLKLWGEELEDVIDLVLEPARKHLISLVQHKHLDAVRAESAAAEHIVHTAGGADHNVDTSLEDAGILTDTGATHTGMALDLEVVTQGTHNLLDLLGKLTSGGQDQALALSQVVVQVVQDTSTESRSLSSTGLSLLDDIQALAKGNDSLLLDGRGLLKTVGIDATQQVLMEVHLVEALKCLLPVREELLASLTFAE